MKRNRVALTAAVVGLCGASVALAQLDNSSWPMCGQNRTIEKLYVGPNVNPAGPTAWNRTTDPNGAPLDRGCWGGPVISSDGFVWYKNNSANNGTLTWLYKLNMNTGVPGGMAAVGAGFNGNRSAPIIGTQYVYVANVATNDIKVFDRVTLAPAPFSPIVDPNNTLANGGYRGISLGSVNNGNGHLNIYATARAPTPDTITAFDSVTGQLMWKFNAPGGNDGGLGQLLTWEAGGKQIIAHQLGNGNPGLVYAIRDDGNAATLLWQKQLIGQAAGTGSVLSADGTKLYMCTTNTDGATPPTTSDVLHALSVTTGNLVWSLPQTAFGFSMYVCLPIVNGNRLYVYGSPGGLAAVDDLGASAQVKWTAFAPTETGEFTGGVGAKNSTSGRTFLYLSNQTSHKLYGYEDASTWGRLFAVKDFGSSESWGAGSACIGPDGSVYSTSFGNGTFKYGTTGTWPVANAGPDQTGLACTYEGPPSVVLDGRNSTGTGLTYTWTVGSTVVGTGPVISGLSVPCNSVTVVTLTVVDANGLADQDQVVVQVGPVTPVPVDDLVGPFATKNGDNFGTGRSPVILPNSANLNFQVITQKVGGSSGWSADPVPDRQFVFDGHGNIYNVSWERKMVSIDKDFNYRWGSEETHGTNISNLNSAPVVVGKRYVYTVGGGNRPNAGDPPSVFAFDKITGHTIWRQPLTNGSITEPILNSGDFRTLAALYNNKLYVVGMPFSGAGGVNDSVRVYQIDVGTDSPGPVVPHVDWAAIVSWGSEIGRYGNLVVIPNLWGTDPGLFFAGRSAAANDGLFDCVGLRVNNSGVVSQWGRDGLLADLSAALYSPVTHKLYIRTQADNWGNYGVWQLDPTTGTGVGTPAMSNVDPQYNEEAWALSSDGQRIWSGGSNGILAKYDSTGADWYYFPYEGKSGNNAVLFKNSANHDILVTGWQYVHGDPNAANYDPSYRIVALDVDHALSGKGTEQQLDDGPWYVDDIVVKVDGVVKFTENFESYPLGPINAPGVGPWVYQDYTSQNYVNDWSAAIVSQDGRKCLKIDPFGANANHVTSLAATMTQEWGVNGEDVVITFNQKRHDLCDNTWTGDLAGTFGVYQWDGAGDPQYQKAYGEGGQPPDAPTANLTAGAWQAVMVDANFNPSLDYLNIMVDGQNNGEVPPYIIHDPPHGLAKLEFWMWATPVTCSGFVPPLNQPLASKIVNDGDPNHDPNNPQWGSFDGLTAGPDGSIYYMEWRRYDRRWTRMQLVAPVCRGDCNCDGNVDFGDINPFVAVLSGGTPCNFDNCDVNGDGHIDFGDINPFVAILSAGGGPCP